MKLNGLSIACILSGFTFGLGAPAFADEDDNYFFSRSEVYGYSAAFPAKSYVNLLVGPAPDSGEFAFARTSLEFGLGFNSFELSAIHRNDYNIRFSEDSAFYSYRNKNKIPIPFDTEYVVDVWANQYQASGAKLAYIWDASESLKVKVAYSHLYATEIVSGYMGKDPEGEGGSVVLERRTVGSTTLRALTGDLYADYYYTDDPLFEREVNEPSGVGYAIDLAFSWQVNDTFEVHGAIDDLAGEIKWDGIGHTTATATSDTFTVDENGFATVNPNFEGIETYDDYTQDLTRRESLGLSYQLRRWHFGYDFVSYPFIDLHNVTVGYNWSKHWGLRFTMEPETNGKSFQLKMPVGRFHILFDTLDFDQAKTIGFGWSFNLSF